jgi:hypothetical protein
MAVKKTLKNIRRFLALVVLALTLSLQPYLTVYADSLENLIGNGKQYYIPGDGCGLSTSGIAVNSTIPADVVSDIEKNKAMYVAAGQQTDLPWQVLAAIHYRESSLSQTKDLQAGNPIGGPYTKQSTSYAKYGYPKTIEESVVFAAKELQDKAQAGLFKKKITMAAIDTEVIKDALFGYNGRAEAYAKQAATYGFDSKTQPFEGSPYVMNRYDAARQAMGIITVDHGGIDDVDHRFGAFTLYNLMGGPKSGTSPNSVCPYGAGATGLLATILSYAWPQYHKSPYCELKPSYAAAISAAYGHEYVGWHTCYIYNDHPGADCGGFVTRAMRDSKADPEYNKYQGPVDQQWKYLEEQVKSPTGKYIKLTNVTRVEDLRPGDIWINQDLSHTQFYVGQNPGYEFNAASASGSSRVDGSWRTPMSSPISGIKTAQWYRLKGPTL